MMFFAVSLMPLGSALPAPARAEMPGCPSSAAKFAKEPQIVLPADAKVTSPEVDFEVDIGSDGRVRGLQLDRSSGDANADLEFRQQLQAASYLPPQSGCVASSGALYLRYPQQLPPGASPAPLPKLNPRCTPFVTSFLSPHARDRKHTGTAIVAVELDAAATQTAAPVLRSSTGSPALDKEALRIARDGQYQFEQLSSCTPQPFTYLLELTFQ
jgi:TonB family protein